MTKKYPILILLLLSISLVSAITIYSGDSKEIELEKPYEYYSIVGNQTLVILNITENGNGNNVTITPNKYSLNDRYEIIFFDSEKETITIHSGGGGGSRTVYKDRNVTEYVDKEIIIYENKEIKVPGETIEVEKIVNKIPSWVYLISLVFVIIILYFIFRKDTNERRYDEHE